MAHRLLTHEDELIRGEVVDRPNRFVLEVRFDREPERVFLGDPGALEVLSPGSTVLCSPVDDPDRKTAYDAIAVQADDVYVSLRAALANTLFAEALTRDLLPAFTDYTIHKREPALPDHGRADLILSDPAHASEVFVEVKSCTHANAGVGKFPDRPTERGRRHVTSLMDLEAAGTETHLGFVAQRPDVAEIRPFRAVDPAFAEVLGAAAETGVRIHGLVVKFDPPDYLLEDPAIPVKGADGVTDVQDA